MLYVGGFKALPSSGTLYKKANAPYADSHDAAEGDAPNYDEYGEVGQIYYEVVLDDDYYVIERPVLMFDTSRIGEATFLSAFIEIFIAEVETVATDYTLHIVDGSVAEDTLVAADYGDLLSKTTSCGSIAKDDIEVGKYNRIELNATGLALINKTGITKFALRLSTDIDGVDPYKGSPQDYPEQVEYVSANPASEDTVGREPILFIGDPPQVRVSAVRHVYRPGSYRAELTFGGVSTTADVVKSETILPSGPEEGKETEAARTVLVSSSAGAELTKAILQETKDILEVARNALNPLKASRALARIGLTSFSMFENLRKSGLLGVKPTASQARNRFGYTVDDIIAMENKGMSTEEIVKFMQENIKK